MDLAVITLEAGSEPPPIQLSPEHSEARWMTFGEATMIDETRWLTKAKDRLLQGIRWGHAVYEKRKEDEDKKKEAEKKAARGWVNCNGNKNRRRGEGRNEVFQPALQCIPYQQPPAMH